MANPNIGFGLRAITNVAGTAPEIHSYTGSTAAALYPGQMVCLDGGVVTVPTQALIAAGKVLGVMKTHLAATATDKEVFVYDSPDQEYEVRHDGTSTEVAATGTVGFKFALTGYSDVNTTSLQSDAKLDTSTGTATVNTTTFLVMKRYSSDPTQVNSQSYPLAVVKIHNLNHIYGSGS